MCSVIDPKWLLQPQIDTVTHDASKKRSLICSVTLVRCVLECLVAVFTGLSRCRSGRRNRVLKDTSGAHLVVKPAFQACGRSAALRPRIVVVDPFGRPPFHFGVKVSADIAWSVMSGNGTDLATTMCSHRVCCEDGWQVQRKYVQPSSCASGRLERTNTDSTKKCLNLDNENTCVSGTPFPFNTQFTICLIRELRRS